MTGEKLLIDASHKNVKVVLEGVPYYPDEIWKFAAMAERFPAIDAVEVVRCKDCKYLMYSSIYKQLFCKNTYGLRNICISKDDFCSHGERKMVNLEDVVDVEAQTKANNDAMRKVIDFMVEEKDTK